MTAYRVVEPFQVHLDGVTHGAGETVSPAEDIAAYWLNAGWIEPADDKPKPRARKTAP